MKSRHVILLLVCTVFAACATAPPLRTQLEIREFQTRSYETTDGKMVMKAVMNVLQDDGYIIKSGDLELGLLNASKMMDIENKTEAFWRILAFGQNARWKKNCYIESSANVSNFGDQCRVRVNFQMIELDNLGVLVTSDQIDDEFFYQEFFAKVDKGIFIQKEKL